LNFLNKMERKFGRYAIKNLMMYIIALNAFVFILTLSDPEGVMLNKLMLVPEYVLQGEVWRLFTFIFIPPSTNMVFIFFVLYFYYLIGSGLEHEWGSFKFNVYYLLGMFGTMLAAFISKKGDSGLYLNMSLFLAFAYIYPEYEVLLFFFLPVKMKILGWIDVVILTFTFFTSGVSIKLAILAAFINFGVFFGKEIYLHIVNRNKVYSNRKKHSTHVAKKDYYHRCTVCGRTEKDDKNLEFRYCSGCEGHYEYCMEHLKDHQHKTAMDKVIGLEDYKRMKSKKS
jgi:hypothetical protein